SSNGFLPGARSVACLPASWRGRGKRFRTSSLACLLHIISRASRRFAAALLLGCSYLPDGQNLTARGSFSRHPFAAQRRSASPVSLSAFPGLPSAEDRHTTSFSPIEGKERD